MKDVMQRNEIPDVALVAGLQNDGYIMDPLDTLIVSQLTGHQKPQLRELGNFFAANGNWGTGTEYRGRLARAQEAVGIAKPIDLGTREQFEWQPGDVIDVVEFASLVQKGEEIQITDYKGRRYFLVKGEHNFTVIGAYVDNQSLADRAGKKLEGQDIVVSKFETEQDKRAKSMGLETSYIRLVEQGTELRPSKYGGEEYTEVRNGRPQVVAASRLQMNFDEFAYGVLASRINLVPDDPHERERLEAAQWRIQDSIQTLRNIIQPTHLPDGRGFLSRSIALGKYKLSEAHFDSKGAEMSFHLEDTENEVLVEYSFGPVGSLEKKYVKVGERWIPPLMQGQKLDGSYKVHTLQAARTLDEIRYAVQQGKESS